MNMNTAGEEMYDPATDALGPAVRASKRVRRMTSHDDDNNNTMGGPTTSKKRSKDSKTNAPIKVSSADHMSAESSAPSVSNSNPSIAVFLQKTFAMVNDCDPTICTWSTDGDSFTIKDPERFESDIIPNYFGHSKLSSFARQLNFYGFHKVQSKPIRNTELDPETSKYLVFANEHFKRGRLDLLTRIQRSTRGGHGNDQEKELETLKSKVSLLEEIIQQMSGEFNRRIQVLEMSCGIQVPTTASTTGVTPNQRATHAFTTMNHEPLHNNPLGHTSGLNMTSTYPRSSFSNASSSRSKVLPPPPSSTSSSMKPMLLSSSTSIPPSSTTTTTTLPPHPKQKFDLDDQMLQEISLLRGVSTLGGLRGLSIDSLPMGLEDASNHNWNHAGPTPTSTSFLHTSPSSLNRNGLLMRDQSTFSLSLDAPLPPDES